MKHYSFTYALIGLFLVFSAILLVNCNGSAGDKTPVTEEKAALTDTTALTNPVVAIEQRDTIAKIVAPPPAKPAPKKTPVAKKATPAKQQTSKVTPPATQPAKEKTEVVIPATTTTPKEETKPAPPPPPAPKTPVVKQVAFTLKSTKAVIKGSSTLHPWESNITQMEGKGSFETKDEEIVAVKNVEIKITVKGIKSKEGKKMDDKTFDTFKSDDNPYIIYTLSNAAVKINDSNAVTIEANGKLTMAGNTQSVPLSATGKKLPNGDLQLSVSKKLKMTDFKMEPPVMMLGTIKVGNEVTVVFDFVLER
ncbi:MAG: YceI family protein [Saprospiraceae bacterium]|nr:YceI family protein [Saprospiraceae bacterium]